MKEELGRKILKEFVELRAKTYTYLTDDNNESQKAKVTKKLTWKKLKFEDYKNCLQAFQLENKMIEVNNNKIFDKQNYEKLEQIW